MVHKTEISPIKAERQTAFDSSNTRTRQLFMESCGRFAQSIGLSRSWGTIYGFLYLSVEPVGLKELAKLTGISKGSASMGTRQLLSMGLIRKTWYKE